MKISDLRRVKEEVRSVDDVRAELAALTDPNAEMERRREQDEIWNAKKRPFHPETGLVNPEDQQLRDQMRAENRARQDRIDALKDELRAMTRPAPKPTVAVGSRSDRASDRPTLRPLGFSMR